MTVKKTHKNELVMTRRASFKIWFLREWRISLALIIGSMILGAGLADLAR